MYTEEVPIYIYQSFNYTEDVRQGIQKRYLYIPINYTEEVRQCKQKR